jgi:hypothetical protein
MTTNTDNTMTEEAFLESTSRPALAAAVIAQMGGWENFTNYAAAVTEHGAEGGFLGFVYYHETGHFYADNQREIVAMAKDLAADIGEKSALALVAGFRCLEGENEEDLGRTLYGTPADHDSTTSNALAWFALEEIARAYVDALEA